VVACCVELLAGHDADDDLVFALGGPAARSVLDGGQRYWLRVWAMRALLYAWHDSARPAVLSGLTDQAWRVREMAAKVIVRRRLGEALTEVADLRDDPVPRVRAAAARAVTILTAAGA
jgi:HEAT repeats